MQLPDDALELRHTSEINNTVIGNMNGRTDAVDGETGEFNAVCFTLIAINVTLRRVQLCWISVMIRVGRGVVIQYFKKRSFAVDR